MDSVPIRCIGCWTINSGLATAIVLFPAKHGTTEFRFWHKWLWLSVELLERVLGSAWLHNLYQANVDYIGWLGVSALSSAMMDVACKSVTWHLSDHFHYITVELADLENIGNNTNDMFPLLSNIKLQGGSFATPFAVHVTNLAPPSVG